MASNEEDEDLDALRSAVLASMKVKPAAAAATSATEEDEDAELLALREAALKTQKRSAELSITTNITAHHKTEHVQNARRGRSSASNLIVIRTVSLDDDPAANTAHQPSSNHPAKGQPSKLLLPQDRWAGATTIPAVVEKKKKVINKFSRFESDDSDSDEESSSSESESDTSEFHPSDAKSDDDVSVSHDGLESVTEVASLTTIESCNDDVGAKDTEAVELKHSPASPSSAGSDSSSASSRSSDRSRSSSPVPPAAKGSFEKEAVNNITHETSTGCTSRLTEHSTTASEKSSVGAEHKSGDRDYKSGNRNASHTDERRSQSSERKLESKQQDATSEPLSDVCRTESRECTRSNKDKSSSVEMKSRATESKSLKQVKPQSSSEKSSELNQIKSQRQEYKADVDENKPQSKDKSQLKHNKMESTSNGEAKHKQSSDKQFGKHSLLDDNLRRKPSKRRRGSTERESHSAEHRSRSADQPNKPVADLSKRNISKKLHALAEDSSVQIADPVQSATDGKIRTKSKHRSRDAKRSPRPNAKQQEVDRAKLQARFEKFALAGQVVGVTDLRAKIPRRENSNKDVPLSRRHGDKENLKINRQASNMPIVAAKHSKRQSVESDSSDLSTFSFGDDDGDRKTAETSKTPNTDMNTARHRPTLKVNDPSPMRAESDEKRERRNPPTNCVWSRRPASIGAAEITHTAVTAPPGEKETHRGGSARKRRRKANKKEDAREIIRRLKEKKVAEVGEDDDGEEKASRIRSPNIQVTFNEDLVAVKPKQHGSVHDRLGVPARDPSTQSVGGVVDSATSRERKRRKHKKKRRRSEREDDQQAWRNEGEIAEKGDKQTGGQTWQEEEEEEDTKGPWSREDDQKSGSDNDDDGRHRRRHKKQKYSVHKTKGDKRHSYESELDAKIRKIQHENSRIMQRKRQVDEDKKRHY